MPRNTAIVAEAVETEHEPLDLLTASFLIATLLRTQHEALNVLDGVHLGSAAVLDDPIVSADTLLPEIPEIEHIDPRNLE